MVRRVVGGPSQDEVGPEEAGRVGVLLFKNEDKRHVRSMEQMEEG